MKSSHSKLRRVARWLLALLAILVIALALMPLWLPWALRPVLGGFGVHFKSYQRSGFDRFSLKDVSGEWKNTRLHAERVECIQPAVWLWQRLFPDTNNPTALLMTNGVLTVQAKTNGASRTKKESLSKTLDDIARIGLALRRNLPGIRLTNCAVQIHSTRLMLPGADWRGGGLIVQARAINWPHLLQLHARIENSSSLALSATADPFALDGKFTRDDGEWRWSGDLNCFTNHAELSARFTTNSWWPTEARLASREVRLPADWIRVRGYQDLTAALAVNLVSNQFELQATGFALPTVAGNGLPRVEATLHARGDPDSASLDRLHIQTPWLQADLTNRIGIRRTGELFANVAKLQVALDLAKIPNASVSGHANGFVSVELKEDHHPVALFDFEAGDVQVADWNAKTFLVNGTFDWPVLKLNKLTADLADGSTLRANGSLDVLSREVREARWQLGGKFAEKLVPGFRYSKFEASGTAHGSLTNLAHSGKLTVENLQGDSIKPLQAKAEWKGTNFVLSSATVEATAGASAVELAGSFNFGKSREISAALNKFSLRRADETLYALQQPCAISFRRGNAGDKSNRWSLAVAPFNCRGGEREFSFAANLDFPLKADVKVNAKHVKLRDLAGFATAKLERISIPDLAVDAGWSNGPLHATITGGVAMKDQRGDTFTARGKIKTGELVEIEQLTFGSEFAPALHVEGSIPLQVFPGRREGWIVADEERAIALSASSQTTNQQLTISLGPLGQLELTNASVQIHASGTLAKPSATVAVAIGSVDWQSPTNSEARPKFDQFKLNAEVRPGLIELRELAGKIDGQPVHANGEWPLAANFWRELWAGKKAPDWRQAHGQLQLEETDVAVISHYLPKILAPEGRVKIDLSLAPGGKFGGLLVLTNAATRSLGDLTPLRDITARVRLEDSKAVLEEFRGDMGGQPVRATGFVRIPLRGDLDYQVSLQSRNVPLVRSVEFLLRGDLNVELKGGKDAAPALTGDVTLRDGLYVEYASSFVWSKPKRPELRPPYFSVKDEPFANWKLNLTVHGDRFLRARTPFFNGVVSANVKLQGTLAEPAISGDARVDSGRVIFPFGTLAVDQGYASLDGSDLRGPRLQINASGRNLNYDVHLEVKGPADGADVLFTSTPPLTSEEILLMLTAGEIPQGQFAYSAQARAGRLATFVGKDLYSRFSGGGTSEEKLIVTTGENVTEEGRLTYSAEYRFTDRWSIVGEYDRFNAFNAHLKWKILSR